MTTAEELATAFNRLSAREQLERLEQIERAVDRALQPVVDSLGLKNRADLDKRIKGIKDAIKAQLEADQQAGRYEPLHDGELDVTAELQDRKGTTTYDLVTLAKETDGYALIEAAQAGMLRVDHTSLDRFRKGAGAAWADEIARFEMPGQGSTALLIKRGGR